MTNPTPARLLALGGASLALLASPLSAQTPLPPSAVDLAQRGDDLAWSITEDLTTEIGQRMADTEAEAAARRWAVARLRSMGFANVRDEPFDMHVWVRGEEEAWPIGRAWGRERGWQYVEISVVHGALKKT